MHLEDLFSRIDDNYCGDHAPALAGLRSALTDDSDLLDGLDAIEQQAITLCRQARMHGELASPVQQLLHEFSLSSEEGLALMVLIEALARINNPAVASRLMADSLSKHDWLHHCGHDKPAFVNLSSLLLLLTGKVLHEDQAHHEKLLRRLLRRLSQPMIHASIQGVIHHVAKQFVFANSAQGAVKAINARHTHFEHYSLDMLGEEALSYERANEYLARYQEAIQTVADGRENKRCGVSIKLSALYPRYEPRHFDVARHAIVQALAPLLRSAQQAGVDITIDAEEAHRLELGLCIYTDLVARCDVIGKSPIGMAVQAYSPRAFPVLQYLRRYAHSRKIQLPIRLVKGAYWDSEIKLAQLQGLTNYPVFCHKQHTDLSYLACAQFLLHNDDCFYPQFATHNALTIAHILETRKAHQAMEFQRLHGMGEHLYDCVSRLVDDIAVRVYAPVGEDKELLPYLIRRLLENGANNSFVRQMGSHEEDISALCRHPLRDTTATSALPSIADLYQPERSNSPGFNLNSRQTQTTLQQQLKALAGKIWNFTPLTSPHAGPHLELTSLNPYDGSPVGHCLQNTSDDLNAMVAHCSAAASAWRATSPTSRASHLYQFGNLLQQHRIEMISLLVREAGKTIADAHDELREAIDFANYYARQAETTLGDARQLPGPVGEENTLHWKSRGTFLCISPWNFPLAIFCGQVCAALVCGNPVIAKPSLKTPLIACFAVSLLKQAGIPEQALHLALVPGKMVSSWIREDTALRGVAFTGSDHTARIIHRNIAEREGPRIPLIAETGGQNVMIADCSSLPEQLCKDVVNSAFLSAGQRCSALRVLYIQRDMYDTFLPLLKGYLETLNVGDPGDMDTDIGPLIDHQAKQNLMQHCTLYNTQTKTLYAGTPPSHTREDNLLAPHILSVESITEVTQEHFGPVLHVAAFDYHDIDNVVRDIQSCPYGLTCGIHSRNISWARSLAEQLQIGNVYINRNMVGAIVGSQPFGGMGSSGTGPKAGGPHYLHAFSCEQTISYNSAALGGSLDILVK